MKKNGTLLGFFLIITISTYLFGFWMGSPIQSPMGATLAERSTTQPNVSAREIAQEVATVNAEATTTILALTPSATASPYRTPTNTPTSTATYTPTPTYLTCDQDVVLIGEACLPLGTAYPTTTPHPSYTPTVMAWCTFDDYRQSTLNASPCRKPMEQPFD